MSGSAPPETRRSLCKLKSWSSEITRDKAWENRRITHLHRRGRSLTDADIDDLSACLDLGFGFDSFNVDRRLSSTFPALELFCAVEQSYTSSSSCSFGSTLESDYTPPSTPIINSGDVPEAVKSKLKRWARIVAFSIRNSRKF